MSADDPGDLRPTVLTFDDVTRKTTATIGDGGIAVLLEFAADVGTEKQKFLCRMAIPPDDALLLVEALKEWVAIVQANRGGL